MPETRHARKQLVSGLIDFERGSGSEGPGIESPGPLNSRFLGQTGQCIRWNIEIPEVCEQASGFGQALEPIGKVGLFELPVQVVRRGPVPAHHVRQQRGDGDPMRRAVTAR